ncbi:hypothetical protein PVAND_005218 [Polypedilum vanderplanki]|uniref:Protease inhibitor n=1 Tax=Polypedilum vanderplanki TaxID=319348 RepID=A0A9J6BZX7_POLVA|nr:hypothetical protein PVAND_005218 [Polypedilum vanderplanki]
MFKIKIFVLIFLMFIIVISKADTEIKKVTCGTNEEYTCRCSDSVCNKIDRKCFRCQNGCFCKSGYVRNEDYGICILPSSCP